MAKLVPVTVGGHEILGFLAGKVVIRGDVVAPALSRKDWGSLG
ncbi:MAG: hypothetical protein WA823_06055 [Candidatus Acidiferrales bacterium]